MAWEDRPGNRYYYRKRREGGRVISEYIGAGPYAELMARADQAERKQRAAETEAQRKRDQAEQAMDTALDQVQDGAWLLVKMAALLAGHRPHKGQLRKRSYANR